MDGCRSDDQVRLRERMPRLPAFLNQKPPLEHNVFGNLENPFSEHGPDLICEPIIEIGAAIGLTDQLNAEANLGEGYSADVKLIKRTTGNERHNLLLRLGPPQFRENIRIEPTTPSEPSVTHRHTLASGFQPDLFEWRSLHGLDQFGPRGRRFLVRSSSILPIRSRRRLQGWHEDILDVLKRTTFHPLVNEGFEFRSLNLNRHRRRLSLIVLRPAVSADRPARHEWT
jgi:hypothetical protein